MIIKNDKFELEISEETGVYFGSKTSGQHFRKWEDCREDEKQRIEMIRREAEELLRTSERIFLNDPFSLYSLHRPQPMQDLGSKLEITCN